MVWSYNWLLVARLLHILILMMDFLVFSDSYRASDFSPPTATSEPQQGFVRSNPVPYGTSLTHNEMQITVLDVITSSQIRSGSKEVPGGIAGIRVHGELDEDHEVVLIRVRLLNLAPSNETKSYSPVHFRVAGSRGTIYDEWFTPDGGSYLQSGEFFGGSTVTGWILQQFHESDRNLVLIYSPPFAGSSYYSLEDSK